MAENTLKLIQRDDAGLIIGKTYCFTPDGNVDWKKMVPLEFLYINPSRKEIAEKKYGKKVELIDIFEDKVEDIDLVIKLAGIKQVAKLRGINSVAYFIKESNLHYASVLCEIEFIPNYETEGRSIKFSDAACAHIDNTNGFGQKYLVEMAVNRSYCRCVRNFLGISIVSGEEIAGNNVPPDSTPENNNVSIRTSLLQGVMNDNKISWEMLKTALIKEKYEGAEGFNSIEDIPSVKQFDLVSRIKKKAAAKTAEVPQIKTS